MPTLRGTAQVATTAAGAGATTLAVNKPTGVVAGDIALIYASSPGSGSTWTTAPTGFTAFAANLSNANAQGHSSRAWWRLCDGTEGATFTVTFSATSRLAAVCIAYSGASGPFDPTAPAVCGVANTAGTGSPIVTQALTTVLSGDQLVWFATTATASGTAVPTITKPTSYTAQVTQGSTTAAAATNVGVIVADLTATTPGTVTSPAGSSLGTSQSNSAFIVALTPGQPPLGMIA